MLFQAGGRTLVLAGQKSGDVWAVQSGDGKVVWRHQFGKGTALGGVHWGIATDGVRVFAPISDPNVPEPLNAAGLYAIDIASGKVIRHKRRAGGQPRFSAACSIAGSRFDSAAVTFM